MPRHGLAKLLTRSTASGALAFDRNLPPSEALGRISDAFHDRDDPLICPEFDISDAQAQAER